MSSGQRLQQMVDAREDQFGDEGWKRDPNLAAAANKQKFKVAKRKFYVETKNPRTFHFEYAIFWASQQVTTWLLIGIKRRT